MPCAHAYRLCKHAVFVKPRKNRYGEISKQLMTLFSKYTELIEPLSVDEAFLDVTRNTLNEPSGTRLAEIIRKDILKTTGLTASAGVSYNKFLAKLASDQNKPDGLTVIPPGKAQSFLRSLPIRRFFGVGKVTEKKMLRLGIKTGHDLEKRTKAELTKAFGSSGAIFFDMARGIDHRPVQTHRERKSIGTETTFQTDLTALGEVIEILESLSEKVGAALQRKKMWGKTLTLKVRYDDFTTITRSASKHSGFRSTADIWEQLPLLVAATEAGMRKVRLLGVSISNLIEEQQDQKTPFRQLSLPFNMPTIPAPEEYIRKVREHYCDVNHTTLP
ncbi:MAG: DNA polymerase IV [Deltaproteobacteria bacterium]|nr:MAG: DNA polymerase IV [Deltaproteobacteria bacterium]